MFLKTKAFYDYIRFTRWSFSLGYITVFELIERYKIAMTLIDRGNPARIVLIEDLGSLGFDAEALNKDIEWDNCDQEIESDNSDESNRTSLEQKNLGQKDSDRFDFIRSSPKNTWHFRPGDPDFFPSIPHGHKHGNVHIKLDPYRGEVFDVLNHKQLKSEDRKFIIELWNDDEFRENARKAIDYYVTRVNPRFVWRVPNYRRLPRKRRV